MRTGGGHTTSSVWVVEAGGVVESSDFAGAELVHSRIVKRDYQIVVDTAPEVRIGTETGDSPGFGNVSGLAVDRLGNFFVADGAYLEVRSFSSDGRHLWTQGRSGTGPGEYHAINGLEVCGDAILVGDQAAMRR